MRKILVEVSVGDIVNGLVSDEHYCPIALALRRQGVEVSVGEDILFDRLGGAYERDLPDEAQEFIHRFDNGEPVYPFSFEIEVP